MQKLREKKGAIFDLGSTLIEYENIPWPRLFELSLKRAHENLPRMQADPPEWATFYPTFLDMVIAKEKISNETHVEQNIMKLFRDFLEHFELRGDEEFVSAFLDIYYQPIRESLTLKDGAKNVLDRFKSNGQKLGLISNTVFPPEYHLADMKHFGIYEYFDHMIFSSRFPYRKPHLSIYEDMLRSLDILPSEAFFVGDRLEVDVLGANNAGLFSILIRKAGRDYGDLSAADLVIDELSDLIDQY